MRISQADDLVLEIKACKEILHQVEKAVHALQRKRDKEVAIFEARMRRFREGQR